MRRGRRLLLHWCIGSSCRGQSLGCKVEWERSAGCERSKWVESMRLTALPLFHARCGGGLDVGLNSYDGRERSQKQGCDELHRV